MVGERALRETRERDVRVKGRRCAGRAASHARLPPRPHVDVGLSLGGRKHRLPLVLNPTSCGWLQWQVLHMWLKNEKNASGLSHRPSTDWLTPGAVPPTTRGGFQPSTSILPGPPAASLTISALVYLMLLLTSCGAKNISAWMLLRRPRGRPPNRC